MLGRMLEPVGAKGEKIRNTIALFIEGTALEADSKKMRRLRSEFVRVYEKAKLL